MLARSELSSLPVHERWQAYDDYDAARAHWDTARFEMRRQLPAWRWIHRLDMRRARRAFHNYAKAVRKARS